MNRVSAERSYTPYGYCTLIDDILGFNGEFQDPLSGLYPLGQGDRHFSSKLGRFYRPDDLSPFDRGGLNAYAYCGGDPVNRVDRDGHSYSAVVKDAFSFNKNMRTGNVPMGKSPLMVPSAPGPTTVAGGRNVIAAPSKSSVTIGWSGAKLNLHLSDVWSTVKEMKLGSGSSGWQLTFPMDTVLPGIPNSRMTLDRRGLNISIHHVDALKLIPSAFFNTPASGSTPIRMDLGSADVEVGLRATTIRFSYRELYDKAMTAAKR